MDQSGNEFIKELSTNNPAPGGGSVSAFAGAMGASLASMVAVLTHEKKEFFTRKEEMNDIGVEAQQLKDRLAFLVDEDTKAFNRVMEANRLSDGTDEERKIKESAIEESNKYAIQIPMETAELSFQVMELSEKLVEWGNPNSVSDAGVAAEVGLAAVRGACMNVKINLPGIDDQDEVDVGIIEAGGEGQVHESGDRQLNSRYGAGLESLMRGGAESGRNQVLQDEVLPAKEGSLQESTAILEVVVEAALRSAQIASQLFYVDARRALD